MRNSLKYEEKKHLIFRLVANEIVWAIVITTLFGLFSAVADYWLELGANSWRMIFGYIAGVTSVGVASWIKGNL